MQISRIVPALAVALATSVFLTACGGGGSSTPAGNSAPGPVASPAKLLSLVRSSIPDGALGVDPRMPNFILEFSAPLATAVTAGGQVQLSDGTTAHSVTISVVDGTMTVTPKGPLHTGAEYRLSVKSGVSGSDGAQLPSDVVIKFRTVDALYEPRQLTPADGNVYGSGLPKLIVADVSGDGRPDLVELAPLRLVDHPNGYTLNIFVQDAAGAVTKFQKLDFLTTPHVSLELKDLVVLDIDGDGKPEILVPEGGDVTTTMLGIRVFKAGSGGKFAAEKLIATAYTQTLGVFDVDGDGRPDLVGSSRQAIDQVTGGYQVFLGTPAGLSPMAPVALPYGFYDVAVADFNQDGKRELFINRKFAGPGNGAATNELLVYTQEARGQFTRNAVMTAEVAGFCVALLCTDMRISDLNVDGKPDFVFSVRSTVDTSSTAIVIFNRKPEGGLLRTSQIVVGQADVFDIRDFNGDKIPDLLVVGLDFSRIGNYFSILAGPGLNPAVSNRYPVPVFDTMYQSNVAIGDLDRDGQIDIIFDSYNSGIVAARRVIL